VVQNRKQKRTFDSGIVITSKKGTKTLSERDRRNLRARLGDDGVRHRSTRAKLHGEVDNDEMTCIDVIEIGTKAVVNFFWGVLTCWLPHVR